jgi:stress-induced morphogen
MKNSSGKNKVRTKETEQVERWLRDHFKGWSAAHPPTAYRYNQASIRVRLVSSRFKGKDFFEREEMVLPVIRGLPEHTQADIMILALLTPDELDRSPLNYEFEHPSLQPR